MKPRLLYIDGFNYFYRAFSKDKQSTNEDGTPIGGVITFMRQLFSTINYLKPNYVVICFDGDGAGERRRNIFRDYKDRRGRRKDRLVVTEYANFSNEDFQVDLLMKLLSYFPFLITKVDYLEADDVIEYLTTKNANTYEQFICSTDQDYYQLIKDGVSVWSAEKKIIINKDNFKEQIDVLPENFIYYKVLNGDTSDKIPGVKGLGEDRILKYFPELSTIPFRDFNDLYLLIDDLKDDKTKTLKTIKESKDLLHRNYKLMKLNESNCSESSRRKIKEQLDMQYGFQQSLLLTFSYLQKKKYNIYFKDVNNITNLLKQISTKLKLEA